MSESPENKASADLKLTSDDSPQLKWSTHPMRRRPWVTVMVTLFVMLCGALVYFITDHSRLFSTLTLVALYMSLAKFYFPTKYIMNVKGVIVHTTTQKIKKPWSMYRSFYPDKNGVLLSPFAEPTRLENFRGLYILFHNNRDEVVEFLKNHIGSRSATNEAVR